MTPYCPRPAPALQGSGQAAPALPNSTAPLKVVGGNNFSQVVASWDTTYGIIGNDTLQLNRPPSDATSSGPPVQINSGSFAVGAVVGIAAAGERASWHAVPCCAELGSC